MTRTRLCADNLTIRDPSGAMLVQGITFAIESGRSLTIIGESGGGKSLIAQAIMGLLPDGLTATGTIHIGEAMHDAGAQGALRLLWARETLLLAQEPRLAFDPTLAIGRQIGDQRRLDAATVTAALDAVDLPSGTAMRFPHEVSGGMAQRALVATALVSGAPIVIADEPTKGLDPARNAQVGALLRKLVDDGRALIVISHDLALAQQIGGDLLVLEGGAAREQGTVAQVLREPEAAYTRRWLESRPESWRGCRRCLAMSDAPLVAHGLAAGYAKGAPLFSELHLHLPAGGVIGLAGPSGCGKTTLGNVLLGLMKPVAGQVLWRGADPYANNGTLRQMRRRYQKLHQDPASAFIPHRRLGDQIADLAEVAPAAREPDRIAALLDRLKLKSALLVRYPGEISGGEAQRLALLRLLLLEPEVIVADEPTSRLDPLIQKEAITLMRGLVDETGLALVLIAHDRALLGATADEVITLG